MLMNFLNSLYDKDNFGAGMFTCAKRKFRLNLSFCNSHIA